MYADSHNVLTTLKNYFCQLLNVHGVNDIRHIKMHTAEPLVPEPHSFEVETAVDKLKRCKLLRTDQIWQN
jgi:hypothetical protein